MAVFEEISGAAKAQILGAGAQNSCQVRIMRTHFDILLKLVSLLFLYSVSPESQRPYVKNTQPYPNLIDQNCPTILPRLMFCF